MQAMVYPDQHHGIVLVRNRKTTTAVDGYSTRVGQTDMSSSLGCRGSARAATSDLPKPFDVEGTFRLITPGCEDHNCCKDYHQGTQTKQHRDRIIMHKKQQRLLWAPALSLLTGSAPTHSSSSSTTSEEVVMWNGPSRPVLSTIKNNCERRRLRSTAAKLLELNHGSSRPDPRCLCCAGDVRHPGFV